MKMTGRERIMCALGRGTPDRVPATPDMSIMIPTVMAGKSFYDPVDLAMAYIRCARYFGIDGWMFNGTLNYTYDDTCKEVTYEKKTIRDAHEVKEYLTIMHTPDGDLTSTTVSPRNVPATVTEKYIKDIKGQYRYLKYFYPGVTGYDKKAYVAQKKEMRDTGMICCFVDCPGIQNYWWMGIEDLMCAYYEYPEIFEELREKQDLICVRKMELAADAGIESMLTGGSGSITLQSPEIFRKMSLPTIKKTTKIAKQAGIISGIHSCGKEYSLVKMCAEETDLDYVNPLEIPPMGDCELADIKQKFGGKLALMGNLHTTDVMLRGSTERVRLEALRAIRDAGQGGGFVLSTGDQCGYLTPYENIFELVRVAEEFGAYPLDMDKTNSEIERLADLPGK